VHGLSIHFLADKPRFVEVADELLAFLGESTLVIHNAGFDLAFLNSELERCGRPLLARERSVDTLTLARRRNPGGPNRLDDLCVRYGVDNARRTKHGALLDAELLAEVYAELVGGRQASLGLVEQELAAPRAATPVIRRRPTRRITLLTEAEHAAHVAFVTTLGPEAIWRDYASAAGEPGAVSS
jgi:DNA polymerase-3 subunit epsilon